MFKKTMKFDNLEGEEVEQTFYFNYNKKEIAELLEFKELEQKINLLQTPVSESGLSELENTKQAYDIFQDLILDAYGEKGADNVTFVKNEELRTYWKNHVAFVELIFEFLANPQAGAEFIENCLPAKMVAKAKEEMQRENAGKLTSATLTQMVQEADRRQSDPATAIAPGDTSLIHPPEDLTPEDIREMDDVAFRKLDVQKLSREAMVAAFQRKSG